jgi:ketosteroid isomerase-like protein
MSMLEKVQNGRRDFVERVLSAIVLVFLVAARGAAAEKSAEATVLALDAERTRAMVAGDVAALDRIFAADAVYTHSTGRAESKTEFIESIRSGARKYKSMACRDVRARVAGGAVILTGNAEGVVEAGGRDIPLSLVFTSVYVEKAARWELAAYESTNLPESGKKESAVPHRATGAFDVKMTPQKAEEGPGAESLGRFSMEKRYHGALNATARGQMLTVGTKVEGSAVYVAVEQVDGTLDGRKGTFALNHTGTMARGAPHLAIAVVPDSGTGELMGIAGTLDIRIEEGGKHFYDFEYTLP